MLNYEQHWQHPLFVQWQNVPTQAIHENVNYSCGIGSGVIHLRGRLSDEAFVAGVQKALGVSLPEQAKEVVYAEQAAIFWLSPDEWMLVSALQQKNQLLHALQDALKDVFAQVVDNSGGFMLLRLHGKEATTVLRHLMTYDVASLQVDQCVHTAFKRSTIVVSKVADNDYALVFRRSFADYVWRVLQKTAKPYGFAVQKNWQFTQAHWQRYTV